MRRSIFAATCVALMSAAPVAAQPAASTAPAQAAASPAGAARGFGFVALNVTDMERSLRFYHMLGLVEQFRSDHPDQLELGLTAVPDTTPNLLLVLKRRRTAPPVLGDGFSRIAFMVKGLDALCARLAADGRKVRPPVALPGGAIRVAFTEDPDGYRVELIE